MVLPPPTSPCNKRFIQVAPAGSQRPDLFEHSFCAPVNSKGSAFGVQRIKIILLFFAKKNALGFITLMLLVNEPGLSLTCAIQIPITQPVHGFVV
jgi:hypothetical protein